MIERERTSAVHLLVAVPVAALAGGGAAAVGLILMLSQQPAEVLSAIIPFTLVFGAYVLPFAIVFGLPAYFLLRRHDRLKLYWVANIGVATGLLVGLLIESTLWGEFPAFTVWGGWIGLNAAAAGYGALRLLTSTTLPHHVKLDCVL
jgi:hypothetical protein